jgi:hypothetical protein
MTRPAGTTGEVRTALLKAARQLATQDRAGTLQELAHAAQVGIDAARRTVDNMRRAGELERVRWRRVSHRNRPVAEYAPAAAEQATDEAVIDIATLLNVWARG